MSDKRILYLISRENVSAPGVMQSQVLDLLAEARIQDPSSKIVLLNLPSLPIFLKHIKKIKNVKKFCHKAGITLFIFPIIPIGQSFMPKWAIPLFLIQTVPLAIFFSLTYRINLIHSRSYLASLLAYFVKKITGIKFIFDTRSIYLKEAETHGIWKKSDPEYRFWEELEKNMFRSADKVIVLASEKESYIKERVPTADVSLIPSPVRVTDFAMPRISRSKGRKSLGIAEKFVFTYSGSLGGLHSADFIASFYSRVSKHVPNPHFLIATQSDPSGIISSLDKLGIRETDYTVLKNPALGDFLPLADVGIHVYPDVPIAPYVSSVKLPEYCASAIPTIVTSNMVSMAKLVREKYFGVVVDNFEPKHIRDKMQKLVKEHSLMGKKAFKLANTYFSVKVCAQKYLEIYNGLLKKTNA